MAQVLFMTGKEGDKVMFDYPLSVHYEAGKNKPYMTVQYDNRQEFIETVNLYEAKGYTGEMV